MHTTAANLAGQPAITLPLGQSRSGLTIGIQFMARFGEEDALIRIASSLEKEMPWCNRIPPIHVTGNRTATRKDIGRENILAEDQD